MKKILVILTNKYPYGTGETFIDAERSAWKLFDHTYICPVLVNDGEEIRPEFQCNANETLVSSVEHKPRIIDYIKGSFGYYTLAESIKDSSSLNLHNGSVIRRFKVALSMGIRSNLRIKRIEKVLEPFLIQSDADSKILLYSYWMFEPVLVGVGIRDRVHASRFITRAHGYDIYEERHLNAYIPYRQVVFDAVDRIYTISKDGKTYLDEKYNGKYKDKVVVSRLGTIKLFEEKMPQIQEEGITIASCAYMKPLKRLHLIIEALSRVDERITWYHFGDGVVRKEIEEMAQKLPENITVVIMGLVPNSEIQKFYATHYIDAFVNVSETEGIPVSIMESQAYGIPAVVTNVGGTSEIVHDHINGILLESNFSSDDLIGGIHEVVLHSKQYREQAKNIWAQVSNASTNHLKLFKEEYNILG